MKIFFAALLLAGVIASSPTDAASGPQVFTAYTTGELSIDAEGRVVDLSIDRKRLDAEVMRDVEAQMRQWRFEPIIENGQPVAAKAVMWVNLVAVSDSGGEGYRVAFENVHFRDLARHEHEKKASPKLAPPLYPADQLARGIGARVNLMLRVDGDGRVSEVSAASVDLLDNDFGGDARRHAAVFARAAKAATVRWRFPHYKGRVVTVPVRFYPHRAFGDRWIRTHSVPIEVPGWVTIEQSSVGLVALGDGGSESSERWKLVTQPGG